MTNAFTGTCLQILADICCSEGGRGGASIKDGMAADKPERAVVALLRQIILDDEDDGPNSPTSALRRRYPPAPACRNINFIFSGSRNRASERETDACFQ